MTLFNAEGRYQRRLFREKTRQEWESTIAPVFDQENTDGQLALYASFEDFLWLRLSQYDSEFAERKESFVDDLRCAALSMDTSPDGISEERAEGKHADELRKRLTNELWAGLRRVYFGELEDEPGMKGLNDAKGRPESPDSRKRWRQQAAREFKSEIEDTRARYRGLVPDDLNCPPPFLICRPDDSSEDDDTEQIPDPPLPDGDDTDDILQEEFEEPPAGSSSNGEDSRGAPMTMGLQSRMSGENGESDNLLGGIRFASDYAAHTYNVMESLFHDDSGKEV